MPFSEATKLVVKRKSHFSCCLCRSVGIELHHIVPQASSGPDTEDNAAPLCPSCNETYGANPTKRKFIREARDFWYEVCATRYAADASRIDTLQQMLQMLPTKSDMEQLISRASTARAASTPDGATDNSEDTLPSELSESAVTDEALRAYLRFMYGYLAHCGPLAVSRLVTDLTSIGHTSIRSLHALLSRTRGVTAEVVHERRNAGENIDSHTDEFPIRLFLAVIDENYCKRFHPAVHAKYSDKTWIRSLASA